MVHHLALIALVGTFVLRVVQARVEEDGGVALDDAGLRPSYILVSGPSPPWLQADVLTVSHYGGPISVLALAVKHHGGPIGALSLS